MFHLHTNEYLVLCLYVFEKTEKHVRLGAIAFVLKVT